MSPETFERFVVSFPMLFSHGFLATALKVLDFGGSSTKSLGLRGKVIGQQGIKELFAFDVVKSN